MMYFVLCGFCGWAFLRLFQKEIFHTVNAFSALIIGILIWNILALLVLMCGLNNIIFVSLWIYIPITILLVFYSFIKYRPSWKEVSWFSGVTIIQLLIILFNNYATAIGDSGYMILMGVDIGRFGTIPRDTGEDLLWAYPLFLPLYQATISKIFFLNEFKNIAPVIGVSLGGLLASLIYDELNRFNLLQKQKTIISILVMIMVFSSHNMFIQLFYFNHHLLVAFVFILWIAFYLFWMDRTVLSPYLLFLLLAIGLTIMRIEGYILSMILLTVTLKDEPFKTRKYITISYVLFFTFLNVFLLMNGDSKYSNLTIINEKHIAIMITTSILYLSANLMFEKSNIVKKMHDTILTKSIYLTGAITFALMIFSNFRELFWKSLLSFMSNLFGVTGFWGLTWYVILFLSVFIYYKKKEKIFYDPIFMTIVLIFNSYLGMLFFRQNYRIGFGDSFNRGVAVQLLPLIILFIIKLLGPTQTTSQGKAPAVAKTK
jgi:hypothetical protein